MLRVLGGLLDDGDEVAESDITAAVGEESAAPKSGRYRMRADLAAGDFTTPGCEVNPEYAWAEGEDARPRRRACGRCQEVFESRPVEEKGEVIFTPLFCPDCAAFHGARLASIGPMVRKELIVRKRFTVGRRPTWENFEGYVLKYWPRTPIGYPVNMKPTTPSATHPPTAPVGHAEHGPSSLHHKEICGHWRSNSGTNAVAEEGTMLHERLAIRDFSGLEEDQVLVVEMVANVFDQVVASLGKGAVAHRELQVNVAGLTWGTADLIAFSADKRRAVVADAKFGYIEVEDASTNLQGISYAIGAWTMEPTVESVEVVFAQPRCDMVSSHTFDALHFPAMVARIKAAVEGAKNPDAPYHPDKANCRYCGVKATCPALLGLAVRATPKILAGFSIPEHLQGANITNPLMMSQALVIADILANWATDLKEHARTMLLEGGDIPDYELGERKSPRGITSATAAWEVVKENMSADEFIACTKTVSIGKLETAFSANAPRGEKAKAKQALEDRLRDHDALKPEGVTHYLKKRKDRQLTDNDTAETE